MPRRDDCDFYHCMSFPDGEAIDRVHWDIRERFQRYIGRVDVTGKTVLDVGTASGFLAFSAEQAGASRVTAIDASGSNEFERVPFSRSTFYADRSQWHHHFDVYLERLRNSFWYSHAKFQSKIEVYYGPLNDILTWNKRFDIVMAGAIIEHLSDPVQVIGNLARLANEKVVIAFTPAIDTEEVLMRPLNTWENPATDYVWWELSIGLYRKVFGNCGFDVSMETSAAFCWELKPPREIEHPTIVAARAR